MSYAQIQAELDAHLETLVGLPPLSKENVLVQLNGTAFTRATLIPTTPVFGTLGTTGKTLRTGTYQVDVFVPENSGSATPNATADAIIAHFNKGLALAGADVTVIIRKAWRSVAIRSDGYYNVPVSVEWNCFTAD